MLLCGLLAILACGCDNRANRKPPEAERLLALDPKQTAQLSETEYLMRKATLGTRSERLEALEVLDNASDPRLLDFYIERLKKEDDRFIQIRIMQSLSHTGDVRAIPPLRHFARWENTRVGVEAIAALYELGDDSFLPLLIQKLRRDEDNPDMAGIAERALQRITGEDLPPSRLVWMNYYRSHPLAPYEARSWYWPFQPPLPPVVEGTTKIAPHQHGRVPLPKQDIRVRQTHVSFQEFWKPDEP
jgi:hypothetical protein